MLKLRLFISNPAKIVPQLKLLLTAALMLRKKLGFLQTRILVLDIGSLLEIWFLWWAAYLAELQGCW